MSKKKSRADMTPEERIVARRKNKHGVYMRKQGRPIAVYPHEHAECRDRIQDFNRRGMSIRQMSEQTGMSLTFFSDRINERCKGTKRPGYDAVMRMQFEAPSTHLDGVRVAGAKIDPIGTRRRLQALMAVGFSGLFIGPLMGCTQQRINTIINSKSSFVYGYTAERVRELYNKYALVDPRDMGVSELSYKRSLSTAKRKGFAPPGAWDDDTIDDPKAHPELTGHCGRMPGVLIHLREGDALCARCQALADKKRASTFNPYELYRMHGEGKTYVEIAQLLGVSRGLIEQYGQFLRREERKVHTLSMVDKLNMTAYCDLCRSQVQIYGGAKPQCANGVRKYREENGHGH